jgi:two-component system OmpR family response regulator
VASRVLVVDDDGAIVEILSTILADDGYAVKAATSGRDALALAREWRPNLILLDLRMPGLDGESLLLEHRQDGLANIPVLLLTAVNHPEQYAATLGVPVLTKPFDIDRLLSEVERLTGRRGPST